MKFHVNPQIFSDSNNPRIGITVVKNANNKVHLNLSSEFEQLTQALQEKFSGQSINEILFGKPGFTRL